MTTEIVPLEPDLLDRIAVLNHEARGRSVARQRTYLAWKYFENPLLTEPLMAVALRDGRAIGMRGYYGTAWASGDGTRFVFPAASDSLVAAEHREGDLYRRLDDASLEAAAARGYTTLVNLSASPEAAVAAVVSFGWKAVLPFRSLSSAADGALMPTWKRRLRMLVDGRHPFARFDKARRSREDSDGVGVHDESPAEQLESIGGRLSTDDRLRLAREAPFLRWRYANPFASYRFLILDEPEDHGFLVLSGIPGERELYVVDWDASTDAGKLRLLDAALAAAAPTPLETWSCTLTDHDRALLESRGFAEVTRVGRERRRKALLVRPVESSGSWLVAGRPLAEAATWDVRAFGSDAY